MRNRIHAKLDGVYTSPSGCLPMIVTQLRNPGLRNWLEDGLSTLPKSVLLRHVAGTTCWMSRGQAGLPRCRPDLPTRWILR
jgi:hypothetical protein